MDKVRNFVLAKREWMTKQMQACQNLPKSSNPPVTSAEIRNEMMVRKSRSLSLLIHVHVHTQNTKHSHTHTCQCMCTRSHE